MANAYMLAPRTAQRLAEMLGERKTERTSSSSSAFVETLPYAPYRRAPAPFFVRWSESVAAPEEPEDGESGDSGGTTGATANEDESKGNLVIHLPPGSLMSGNTELTFGGVSAAGDPFGPGWYTIDDFTGLGAGETVTVRLTAGAPAPEEEGEGGDDPAPDAAADEGGGNNPTPAVGAVITVDPDAEGRIIATVSRDEDSGVVTVSQIVVGAIHEGTHGVAWTWNETLKRFDNAYVQVCRKAYPVGDDAGNAGNLPDGTYCVKVDHSSAEISVELVEDTPTQTDTETRIFVGAINNGKQISGIYTMPVVILYE